MANVEQTNARIQERLSLLMVYAFHVTTISLLTVIRDNVSIQLVPSMEERLWDKMLPAYHAVTTKWLLDSIHIDVISHHVTTITVHRIELILPDRVYVSHVVII